MKNKNPNNSSIIDSKILWQEAKTLFANKEYAKAIEPIDKILEANASDINALLNKGAALYFLNKYDDALACFDTILDIQPQNINALKNKAGALYNLGRYQEANNIYDILLVDNNKDISILKNKAQTFIKLNELDKAADVYNTILSADKNNKQIALKLAAIYQTLHRYQDELYIYNELLQAEPSDEDLLNKKGTALVNLGKFENGIDTFNKILVINIQNEEALLNKKDALEKLTRERKELEEEQTSIEYKTARIYEQNNEGYYLIDKKQYDEALLSFNKVLNVDPQNIDALVGKGIVLLALGNNQEALQYFDPVLEREPDNTNALNSKGKALNNLKQYNEALACFDAVLKSKPNNFDALCNRENTLVLIKNNDIEVSTLETSDKEENTENNNTESLAEENPIGELNIEPRSEDQNQVEETDSVLQKASEAVENEDFDTAITYFEQITDDTLLDEDMLYSKALAYHHLNRYDETINCCNLILDKQPNHISAIALKEDSQNEIEIEKQKTTEEALDLQANLPTENSRTEDVSQDTDTNLEEEATNDAPDFDTLVVEGYSLFEEGEYDLALNYFDEAETLEPNNIRVLIFKGTTYHLQDKIEEAIAYYDKVLAQDPNNMKVLSNKGSALEELAQYNEAIACYKKALDADPRNTNTLFSLGMAYKAISEYATAINYFTQVLEIEPDHAEAIEQKEATEEFLDKMIQEAPQEEEVKTEAETIEAEQSSEDQTDNIIAENKEEIQPSENEETTSPEEVEVEAPSPEEVEAEAKTKEYNDLAQKFNLLYETNSFEEAIDIVDKLLEIDPENIDALYNKGNAFSILKEYDKAIECYDKVLEIDPNYTKALCNKGVALSDLNEYRKAIECYDKVLAIDPNYTKALCNKGYALDNLKEYNKAIECYDKLLAIDPNDIDAIYNKGYALDNLKEYNKAIECYDKVLAIDPNDIDAICNKGNNLGNLDKYDKAIECYDKVLTIEPNHIATLYNKGCSLIKLDKYEEAIEYFDKVLKIEPNYINALYNKAVTCLSINKHTESATSFNKIGYAALDILSLFTSLKERNEEDTLFDVISELIDLNENDYFNKIVTKDDLQRSVYKEIYIRSLKIVKKLHIDNTIEQRVAHYTSHSTANLLFGLTQEQNEPSPFRLNSSATANDPKEGNTLFDYLKVGCTDKYENTGYQAFIGCFSFNTESLNQFRLYSKDNQQEATGVSIVANSNFFSKQIDFNRSLIGSKNLLLTEIEANKTNEAYHNERKAESLFRCIYVDPKTGRIISVGHKEAYSIYRENEADAEIEDKINDYNKALKNLLAELKTEMEALSGKMTDANLDQNTIRELLIVLRYLVKHVAFKEEQECRIINIEELTSDKVKINPYNQQLYIDYLPMSKDSVDIVYSAPLIDQFKIFRDIVWKKRNIRTQICDHPFAESRKITQQ